MFFIKHVFNVFILGVNVFTSTDKADSEDDEC